MVALALGRRNREEGPCEAVYEVQRWPGYNILFPMHRKLGFPPSGDWEAIRTAAKPEKELRLVLPIHG